MVKPKRKETKIETPQDKTKSLDLAVSQIEKQFGEGSIMKLGQATKVNIPAIPTGALSLDMALGIGGLPRGRVVEIYGPEASGKTTLTLSIIAQAQKMGGQAAFIDAEHAFDSSYAKIVGVDLDNLLISQPDTGEQALEIASTLVKSNAVDVIVVDSVAALTPRAEIEGEMGQSHMGLQARLMSQALRKLASSINKSKTCVIFINQIRMKLGIMFGNPETTPGGQALKFYSSVRLDLRRRAPIKRGDEIIGIQVKAKVVKNKVAPPFKAAEFDILYSEGISKANSILSIAETIGVLQKTGTWFSYEGERIGQGKDNAANFLKENPKILNKIEKSVREHAKQTA